jgi:hypothetical protein
MTEIGLVWISASIKSLIKTELPRKIALSLLMSLAAEGHLAEGQLRVELHMKQIKISDISIPHTKADSYVNGRSKILNHCEH